MRAILSTAMLAAAMSFTAAAQAQYLIVGNDEKLIFKDGKPVLAAADAPAHQPSSAAPQSRDRGGRTRRPAPNCPSRWSGGSPRSHSRG